MKDYLYYSKVTRIIVLVIFVAHALISLFFYKEIMFRTRLSLALISSFVLFFSLSFLLHARAAHSSFGNVFRKWNTAEGILNALALLFFAGHIGTIIFFREAYFFNTKYRFMLAYFSLTTLSLSLVIKHKKDPSIFGRIKMGLYALVLLVVLCSIGKLFI